MLWNRFGVCGEAESYERFILSYLKHYHDVLEQNH